MGFINYRYLSITCSATPINQDSNPTSLQPPTRPTKVVFPNKKPQKWSTGTAPGEYGGPPVTTELRKYWGGGKEDPLTSSEYIWNKDFMPSMKRLLQDSDDSSSDPRLSPTEEEDSGFLSFSRVMSLDSLETDLSKELTATPKPIAEKQVEAVQPSNGAPRKWRPAPTRREQDKWDRANKAATGGSDVMFREVGRPKGDPQELAAKSMEQYFKLKKKLLILTLGIGGVGVVSAYISYSPEIAASYGAGLLGSLVYMRMLGNSIDGLADGARGLIKGAVGQPRLLVPVALVMIYNRWNEILVPGYGFMHLELIPMLVGFFTYKIATFAQTIEEAITPAGNDVKLE